MELLVTALIILPGIILALMRSAWLMDYTIWVLALNRCIRRMVDYYFNGAFNPTSPISVTILIAGALLCLCGLTDLNRLRPRERRIFDWMLGALALGYVAGVMDNPIGSLYSLAEWVSGIGAMLFAATHPDAVRVGARWMKTAALAAVVVAAYGWWQYLTIPPWDGQWLVQSGMAGYMGIPEPGKMTCFSTMNERGPCAGFLGFGILPIFLSRKWRTWWSWPAAILCLSVMALTGVRSSFIVVGLISMIQPILNRGKGTGQVIITAAIVSAAVVYGMELLPNAEQFAQRWDQKSLTGEGSSYQGRLEIYLWGIGVVLSHPLGLGLGSSGMAHRVGNEELTTVCDAGYVEIFTQFGWIGGVLFFGALVLMWMEGSYRASLWRAWSMAGEDPFVPATLAILAGMMVLLLVGDVFSGFSLVWVIFGRGLNPAAAPRRARIMLDQPGPAQDLNLPHHAVS